MTTKRRHPYIFHTFFAGGFFYGTKKPEDYVSDLFENVDINGYLYAPAYDDFHGCGICYVRSLVNCPMEECENAMTDFSQLFRDLQKIAKVSSLLNDDPAHNRCVLGSDRLVGAWEKYASDSLFTEEEESELLGLRLDNTDGKASSEDGKKKLEDYYARMKEDAERRIGPSLWAPEFIGLCIRMYRLLKLGAPAAVIENELPYLATAFVINRYGIKAELYKNEAEHQHEHAFGLTDEEEDELHRPKKLNSNKSMAVLCVYKILQAQSSPQKPMHQEELLDILSQYPYEVTIQRKALSRILHTLANSGFGIFTDAVLGSWYDEKGVRI